MLNKIFKKIKKQNRGYTIIEMLVSISIIAVISGIYLMNYKAADNQFLLDQAVQQLAGDIRRAQNYALGQKEFNDSPPAGGWGLFFEINPPNNQYYVLFADVDGDNFYSGSTENFGNGNKKKINFPEKIDIDNVIITKSSGPSEINKNTITFKAPDAFIQICDMAGPSCNEISDDYYEMKIIVDDDIRPNKTGNTRSITINKYGLIDIEH
ncbi:hypothetical protein DRH27_02765 [Candidatus Falkowbacteria bacterium]|nr:MAG: hypothetical protein DRH27_02765 [Candidatus Falkowbacteria bacterium]